MAVFRFRSFRTIMLEFLALFLALLSVSTPLAAAGKEPPVSPREKCPVCGMFVAKYPDFAARIVFRDGTRAVFDGAKDMFKFYFAPEKYTSGRKHSDIKSISVTDYYNLTFINGNKAYFVTGSDIYGPMGKELIPFLKKADSLEFMKDHRGKAILTFDQVTPALIGTLD